MYYNILTVYIYTMDMSSYIVTDEGVYQIDSSYIILSEYHFFPIRDFFYQHFVGDIVYFVTIYTNLLCAFSFS